MLAAQHKGWGGRVTHRRALSPVVRVFAGLMSGTAAVSNLGVIASDWMVADDLAVREIWFSPPAFGADLAVGAVSFGDGDVERMTTVYGALGFASVEACRLSPDEIRATGSSWARRLRADPARPVWRVVVR